MIKNVLAEPEVQKAVRDEKQELAELYRGKARDVLTSISASDIAKASLQQKSISSACFWIKACSSPAKRPRASACKFC